MTPERAAEIKEQDIVREALEKQHGPVWSTDELKEDFDVLSFMAPFAIVIRKSDSKKGYLEFQHNPRFYFNFQLIGQQ